ncbi:MAG: F0F1 ATP synthase subunit B [Chloroflexi bacterium]|nr:F0F1 ATP synthase subunit B [Chloroflexota bacterium]
MEALGINLPGLVAQLINFALLLVLLYIVAYKPILRMMDQRSSRIKKSLDDAEFIKEERGRLEKAVETQLEASRREGQALVAQANQMGERMIDEARQEARREAETLITRARSEIELERSEAMTELRRQFVDLAILAAQRVINRSLDKEAHRRLIDEVLEEGTRTPQN